jgi:chromate transporter
METSRAPLTELALVFGRLGVTSFGGPAAHIALMEEEVVKRREWIPHERFLDLLGLANLVPGPNSSELAMHIGWQRAGFPGLLVAGVAFIAPAIAITSIFAWGYVASGALPALAAPLAGVRAALIAVILGAVWRLGRRAVRSRYLALLGLLVLATALLGGNELYLLLGAGILGACWVQGLPKFRWPGTTAALEPTLLGLTLYCLKIGSILYGSGYVLIAFLQGGLVDRLHWLTRAELLDAVAAGQFTPGPVLSTATFIGYLILGWPGAVLATAGIFLPSFIFVGLTSRLVGRLRKTEWAAAFLDSVNVAALGLMVAVAARLAHDALPGIWTWVIAITAFAVLFRWSVNPAWVVLGSAIVGAVVL